MLVKLMRYEFKAFGRKMLLPVLLMPILAMLSALAREAAISIAMDMDLIPVTISLVGLGAILGVASVIIPIVVPIIMLIVRYNSTMIGNEGYLTFTLPIKISTQLHMRTLSAVIYSVMGTLVAFISTRIFLGFPFNTRFTSAFTEYLTTLHINGQPVWLYEKGIWAAVILGSITTILTAYTALSISTMASKHRILVAGGVFLGINAFFNLVISTLSSIFVMGAYNSAVQNSTGYATAGGIFFLNNIGSGYWPLGSLMRLISDNTNSLFWGTAANASILWESAFWLLILTWLLYFFLSKYLFKNKMSLT